MLTRLVRRGPGSSVLTIGWFKEGPGSSVLTRLVRRGPGSSVLARLGVGGRGEGHGTI